ncbi:hypothetical protein BU14_0065s0015 [Porphyra umbilicalis]|uniref:Uncharacterized protein n=1 Tax=Porphyra umbilicalis TaxID=2786 RepID=A0A1X6PGN7_PORUM|nr:hypothetical protein BU14_0065s0015 [Porphyra umbilicalis]|eukprot:OSX80010.1 hypothetical protein BU14_0065s0015 [Porphyra umbilicalis]
MGRAAPLAAAVAVVAVGVLAAVVAAPAGAFRNCPALAKSPLPASVWPRDYTAHYQASAPSRRNCCCWYKGPASALAPTEGGTIIRVRRASVSAEDRRSAGGGYAQTISLAWRPAGGGGPTLRTAGGGGFSAAVNGRPLRVAGPTRADFVDYFPHLLARVERVMEQGAASCAPDAAQLTAVVAYLKALAWEYGLSTTVGCPLN